MKDQPPGSFEQNAQEKRSVLFTVDVEDWFQVENFKPWIPFSSWPDRELRVERNTRYLLDLLEDGRSPNGLQGRMGQGVKATFFVLAWVAKRLPGLVREIHERGHEVASHGFCHTLCAQQSLGELQEDLMGSKKLLEDILGLPVAGYRAPSFSIDERILGVIENCGYRYDSSFNDLRVNSRYGRVDLSEKHKKGIAYEISSGFHEIPISNLAVWGQRLPWGGGGYFRMIPCDLFKWGVRSILGTEKAYVFFLHPWEIDPEQPRVRAASAFMRFRHYVNLRSCRAKVSSLLRGFSECRFVTCMEYLGQVT